MLLENIANIAIFLCIAAGSIGYFQQNNARPIAAQLSLGAMLIYAVVMLPTISGPNTSFWLYVVIGRALAAFVMAYIGLKFGQYLRCKYQKNIQKGSTPFTF